MIYCLVKTTVTKLNACTSPPRKIGTILRSCGVSIFFKNGFVLFFFLSIFSKLSVLSML